MEKNKRLFTLIFIFHWILLWVSINTIPHSNGLIYMINKFNFFDNFYESLYNLRIFLSLLSSFLIGIFFIFFLLKKNNLNKFHIIFFVIFASYIIGLYFNEERNLNLSTLYLPFLGIGTVMLFYNCYYTKIDFIKYFFWISIFFLSLILIIIILPKISEIQNFDFGNLFNKKDLSILKTANPRITGLSRSLTIINLFIIILYFSIKNNYLKNFLLLIIIIFSVILIFMQSRGSLLCYFVSLFFLIIFLLKDELKSKLKNLTILLLIPFIIFFIINNKINEKNSLNKETKVNTRIFEKHTSGRIDIWTYSIKNHNYKKIFGYGSQGDRYFLKNYINKDLFGNNSSNILLYTMLSGGIISLVVLIIFYFESFKLINKFRKKNITGKNSIYINFSLTCIVFFLIRSIFENSFGLFSIDFLIIFLSIMCITNSNITKKNE